MFFSKIQTMKDHLKISNPDSVGVKKFWTHRIETGMLILSRVSGMLI